MIIILYLLLLGLHEYIYIAIINLKFELFSYVIHKDTDNVPVTEVFNIFFENIPLQTFKGKSDLLMKDGTLEMLIRAIRLGYKAMTYILEHLFGF